MKYRVDWLQTALDQLATMWMQSDSSMRQAINSASIQIDRKLLTDPLGESESRPGGRRILFVFRSECYSKSRPMAKPFPSCRLAFSKKGQRRPMIYRSSGDVYDKDNWPVTLTYAWKVRG